MIVSVKLPKANKLSFNSANCSTSSIVIFVNPVEISCQVPLLLILNFDVVKLDLP